MCIHRLSSAHSPSFHSDGYAVVGRTGIITIDKPVRMCPGKVVIQLGRIAKLGQRYEEAVSRVTANIDRGGEGRTTNCLGESFSQSVFCLHSEGCNSP